MKNKYKVSLILLAILLCSTMMFGYSYSLWNATHTSNLSNNLSIGCFSIDFSESGSNINLTNAYPISDTKGLTKTPYTFTIKNTCTIAASASIAINPLKTTTLDLSNIKASIKEANDTSNTTKILNQFTAGTIASDDTTSASSYVLTTVYLKANASKTYSIWMWLDENAGNDSQDKILSANINVTEAATDTLAYNDGTGAATPELYQGMIPVKFEASGNVIVADTTKEWYNYGQREWANSVLVNCSNSTIKNKYFDSNMNLLDSAIGTTISQSDILQMYTWIPRYKYKLWNTNNESSNPQMIDIVFESKNATKSKGSTNGTYLTHPAFTFGSTELNGIWLGKFETSGTTTGITIKPNLQSLTNQTLGAMFNASRNIENTYASTYGINASIVDTHMMKNMEWGAVAYLSSSIYGRYTDASTCISSGCEIWINNVNTYSAGSYGPSITGCAGASVSASIANSMSACASGYTWSGLGVNASTTGNMYGIYDMAGGNEEYVMGNMNNSSGSYYAASSGLTQPDSKYYDTYAYDTSGTSYSRGILGDATRETLVTFTTGTGAWNSDYHIMLINNYPWFKRGIQYNLGPASGIFGYSYDNGSASTIASFRSVITAQ